MVFTIESIVLYGGLLFALAGIPILLSVHNVLMLTKWYSEKKLFNGARWFFDITTVFYGYALLLLWLTGICGSIEWDKPVVLGGGNPSNHTPVSAQHGAAFWLFTLLAAVFLMMMRFGKKRRPPLLSVIMIAVVIIGNVYLLILPIQLAYPKNDTYDDLFGLWLPALVYALNFLLVTVRAMKREVSRQLEYLAHNKDKETGISHKLYNMLDSTYKWVTAGFIMLLPIIALMTIIFILTGQGADGMIQAFTETADWTFSTKTPPPPEYFKGHYLCTVAAGGHRKIVKPTRYGIRRGERIIVNRQLMIANAFEELIMDKTPRFHKAVRGFYDKHGYPLCKIITTKTRADIVYLLMKPLEWFFLLTLYLFDTYPERRIAKQYT